MKFETLLAVAVLALVVILGGLGCHFIDGMGV